MDSTPLFSLPSVSVVMRRLGLPPGVSITPADRVRPPKNLTGSSFGSPFSKATGFILAQPANKKSILVAMINWFVRMRKCNHNHAIKLKGRNCLPVIKTGNKIISA